jgi:hypothetical protein
LGGLVVEGRIDGNSMEKLEENFESFVKNSSSFLLTLLPSNHNFPFASSPSTLSPPFPPKKHQQKLFRELKIKTIAVINSSKAP